MTASKASLNCRKADFTQTFLMQTPSEQFNDKKIVHSAFSRYLNFFHIEKNLKKMREK